MSTGIRVVTEHGYAVLSKEGISTLYLNVSSHVYIKYCAVLQILVELLKFPVPHLHVVKEAVT